MSFDAVAESERVEGGIVQFRGYTHWIVQKIDHDKRLVHLKRLDELE